MSVPLLEAKDLVGGYGATRILHGLTLEVAEGGTTALLGANGAGKTTLMKTLCGLLPATGGASAGAATTSPWHRAPNAYAPASFWCPRDAWCFPG